MQRVGWRGGWLDLHIRRREGLFACCNTRRGISGVQISSSTMRRDFDTLHWLSAGSCYCTLAAWNETTNVTPRHILQDVGVGVGADTPLWLFKHYVL
jgi:hypothetical protein